MKSSDVSGDFRSIEMKHRLALIGCPPPSPDGLPCRMAAWNSLIALYLQFGELGDAARTVKQASAAAPSQLGELHLEVLLFEGNLGALEYARGNIRAALRHYEKAWDGWVRCERDAGLLHRPTLLSNWGTALLADHQLPAAMDKLQAARRGFELAGEAGSPFLVTVLPTSRSPTRTRGILRQEIHSGRRSNSPSASWAGPIMSLHD